ncbi:dihydrofolate reductase family protein [Patescibacteria group bacterium]|nr:dihydrofolate reductase family protein [Patescibacteria group bacterium]MBP9709535.1 dihydrofolate reductase family protein [Patescibacteria group bacterium]
MRKLIIWNVITLDSCFEGEKPWDLSFHGLVWGPELQALSLEQLQEADMVVFGKNTYQGMADYWPNAQEKEAALMNSIAKVVCSSSLETAEWNNTRIIRDAIPELTRLKGQGDKPMYIFGSGNLSQSLMNAGMIDEIRLCVAPMILGKGRRLFTDEYTTHNLTLLESRPLQNGGIILRYEVNNKI